jgi:hypothetical protein
MRRTLHKAVRTHGRASSWSLTAAVPSPPSSLERRGQGTDCSGILRARRGRIGGGVALWALAAASVGLAEGSAGRAVAVASQCGVYGRGPGCSLDRARELRIKQPGSWSARLPRPTA